MSEFDKCVEGEADPCANKPPGAQVIQTTAVAAQTGCGPRLPTHADSTTTVLDSDIALRRGTGLLHTLPNRHKAGRLATDDCRR